MDMQWVSPILTAAGDLISFLASLPEADRQKAIDRYHAAHQAAVSSLAEFAAASKQDLADGAAALAALVDDATKPVEG